VDSIAIQGGQYRLVSLGSISLGSGFANGGHSKADLVRNHGHYCPPSDEASFVGVGFGYGTGPQSVHECFFVTSLVINDGEFQVSSRRGRYRQWISS
jgi:hypothetical protein